MTRSSSSSFIPLTEFAALSIISMNSCRNDLISFLSLYLLTKYKDKKEIKSFLQEFIEIILNAANSVNGMKDELEDLVISAEFALQQIQTLHERSEERRVG